MEKDAHGNVQLSGTGMLGDLLAQEIKDKLKISRVRSTHSAICSDLFMAVCRTLTSMKPEKWGAGGRRTVLQHGWFRCFRSYRLLSGGLSFGAAVSRGGKTRHMPDEFINAAGNHITDAFKFYVRPLLGSGLDQRPSSGAAGRKILNKPR